MPQMTVTDEAGIASDEISIDLDNADFAIAAPRKGATLQCWLGYEDTGLIDKGLFVVDEIEVSGPPHTLIIKGKAADMRKQLKEQKTRGWDSITINDLVKTIAREHGLIPVVGSGLGSVAIPNLAQTNESDMNLLTRVAKTHDAVSKPVSGRLIFVPKGEAKSATGKAMPSISLGPNDFGNYRATQAERGKYGAVVAQWHNPATGQPESIKVGQGEGPTHTLRHKYPDAGQAQRAATAKMDALERGVGTFSGDVVPGSPGIGAEGKLIVSGLGDIASGEWVITRAVHRLTKGGGLTTSVEAETPKDAVLRRRTLWPVGRGLSGQQLPLPGKPPDRVLRTGRGDLSRDAFDRPQEGRAARRASPGQH